MHLASYLNYTEKEMQFILPFLWHVYYLGFKVAVAETQLVCCFS